MKKITGIILGAIILIISCQKEKFTTSGIANDNFFLKVDGQSLPIKVAGNLDSKKMLIIVHGGPGGPALPYRTKYVRENIEKEFAIVYYDQRFAGASQGNGGIDDISIFRTDLKKVIQLIKKRYGSDHKIYLMGHSWGGFLTPYFLVDGNNQTLVNGWIQVDGASNYYKNDSLTREMLLSFATRELTVNRNITFWQPVKEYCIAHAHNESFDVAFQLNSYAGQAETYLQEVNKVKTPSISNAILSKNFDNLAVTGFASNLYTSALLKKLDHQTYNKNLTAYFQKLTLPTLLLWGRYDFVCPIGLQEDIKKYIGSTDVSVSVFEKSGHSPMNNEEVDFWNVLVNWVKAH
jgi:pimeloyl-ACP methyl ester carboxylesterase